MLVVIDRDDRGRGSHSHRLDAQGNMSKAPTAKTSFDAREDEPLRRADVTAGKLVLRKRGHGAAVRPNKSGSTSSSTAR